MVAADLIHTDVPKSYKEALQSIDKEFWIAAVGTHLLSITMDDKTCLVVLQVSVVLFLKYKFTGLNVGMRRLVHNRKSTG